MAEQLWKMLKGEKISLSLLAVIVYFLYLSYGWVQTSFIPIAAADDYALSKDVAIIHSLIEANGELLTTHISDYTIRDALLAVDNIESDITSVKALQSVGKPTAETESILAILNDKLIDAQEYCDCLIKEEPNCKHLKGAR